MKKILTVCTVPMERGNGISGYILNVSSAMLGCDVRMDYALIGEPPADVRAELELGGGRISVLPVRFKRPAGYIWHLARLIRREGYQAVHVHGNSCTMALDLLAAKLSGCRVRVAHGHNSACLYIKAHRLLRPAFDHLYTHALACGEKAGQWLFENRPFEVVRLAVPTEAYRYSSDARAIKREELGIGKRRAIICVAGFFPQKNHEFLLDAFCGALKISGDLLLLLAGAGETMGAMQQKAQALGISQSVLFLGLRKDVPALLNAADAMALPSQFEGFPTVSIEGQCAGLPMLLSDTITRDCALSEGVRFLPLDIDTWARALAEVPLIDRERASDEGIARARGAGYDVSGVARRLERLYVYGE